jgi:hypothetical protein
MSSTRPSGRPRGSRKPSAVSPRCGAERSKAFRASRFSRVPEPASNRNYEFHPEAEDECFAVAHERRRPGYWRARIKR